MVTGVSVLLNICFNPKNSLAAFFLFVYIFLLIGKAKCVYGLRNIFPVQV